MALNEAKRHLKLFLDNARNLHLFNWRGRAFFIRSASSANAIITCNFNTPDSNGQDFVQGNFFREYAFRQVYITHAAQAGEWIEIEYWGDPGDVDPSKFESGAPVTLANVNLQSVGLTPSTQPTHWLPTKEQGGTLQGITDPITIAPSPDSWAIPTGWVSGSGTIAAAGSTTIYTVTAGKTLRVYAAVVAGNTTGVLATLNIVDPAGPTTVLSITTGGAGPIKCLEGLLIPAGFQVQLTGGAGGVNVYGSICGEEF